MKTHTMTEVSINDVRQALASLVFKIDSERKKGHPLHPNGYPDMEWDLDYPQELNNARSILQAP